MTCFDELDLEQVLSDPVTQAVMKADGVDRAEIETMFSELAASFGEADRKDPADVEC